MDAGAEEWSDAGAEEWTLVRRSGAGVGAGGWAVRSGGQLVVRSGGGGEEVRQWMRGDPGAEGRMGRWWSSVSVTLWRTNIEWGRSKKLQLRFLIRMEFCVGMSCDDDIA